MCLYVGPTRIKTKKIQKRTTSAYKKYAFILRKIKTCVIPSLGYFFEAQKTRWEGGYISGSQVKYFSEISCLTPPPNIPGLKGG